MWGQNSRIRLHWPSSASRYPLKHPPSGWLEAPRRPGPFNFVQAAGRGETDAVVDAVRLA
jgi:hypothetical protein